MEGETWKEAVFELFMGVTTAWSVERGDEKEFALVSPRLDLILNVICALSNLYCIKVG